MQLDDKTTLICKISTYRAASAYSVESGSHKYQMASTSEWMGKLLLVAVFEMGAILLEDNSMKKSLTIVLAFLVSISTTVILADQAEALAKNIIPKAGDYSKKQQDGYSRCIAWCDSHNKTERSRADCHDECAYYWSTHQG